jgi:hypothetical protein
MSSTKSEVREELPTILQLTVNFSLRVDDLGCNIVHGSQRRVSNRARSKAYESCSRSRYE